MENTMRTPCHVLIVDGYSAKSRADLEEAGMKLAWKLYAEMLTTHLPEATYDVLLPSDDGVTPPDATKLAAYDGILWTGCNLSINDTDNPSVRNQLELARNAYEIGVPSFGSCWGLQVAVVAAGGAVEPNPNGKEMGIARKIGLTEAAQSHPMFTAKPRFYEAFISHDDMVTRLPENVVALAGNGWTEIQAAAITHKKGTFWAVQYHPEYDLNEMACLIVARAEKLIELGFYRDPEDLQTHVARMKALAAQPDRKDLRWQLTIDDDVLDASVRQREFINWIDNVLMPNPGSTP